MSSSGAEGGELNPKWDVALESLVREECGKKGEALRLDDFQQLAQNYAIRFDDIMDTVIRMVIHGEWSYKDANGQPQEITQAQMDTMLESGEGRLKEDDLHDFDGFWSEA